MADGFEENVEFFTLTYEAPLRVASNREFAKIAPLLWLRAGSRGRRIDDISAGWDVADAYGVLADLDHVGDVPQGDRRQATTSRSRSSSPTRTGCSSRSRASCPTTSSRCASTRRTCATSRSSPGGARCEVHAEGLPGGRRRRRPRQPRARSSSCTDRDERRRSSFSLTATDRRRQDGDGGGRDRGAVLRQRDVRLRRRTRARSCSGSPTTRTSTSRRASG